MRERFDVIGYEFMDLVLRVCHEEIFWTLNFRNGQATPSQFEATTQESICCHNSRNLTKFPFAPTQQSRWGAAMQIKMFTFVPVARGFSIFAIPEAVPGIVARAVNRHVLARRRQAAQ